MSARSVSLTTLSVEVFTDHPAEVWLPADVKNQACILNLSSLFLLHQIPKGPWLELHTGGPSTLLLPETKERGVLRVWAFQQCRNEGHLTQAGMTCSPWSQ